VLQGRKYGLTMLFLAPLGGLFGIALAAVAGIPGIIAALFFLGAMPPLMSAGIFLILSPGPDAPGHHDFPDWFEEQTTKRRITVFVLAAVGIVASIVTFVLWVRYLYSFFSDQFL
jgi:hypothetical protein